MAPRRWLPGGGSREVARGAEGRRRTRTREVGGLEGVGGSAHLDGGDVVPLHHVAPERRLRARVLLEALGHERVEPHHSVEAVDVAAHAALADRRPVADEQDPAEADGLRAADAAARAAARAAVRAAARAAVGRRWRPASGADRVRDVADGGALVGPDDRCHSSGGREVAAGRQRGAGVVLRCERQRRLLVTSRAGAHVQRAGAARAEPHKLHNPQHDDGKPEEAGERHEVEQQREQQRKDEPREVSVVRQHREHPEDSAVSGEPLQDGNPKGNGKRRGNVEGQNGGDEPREL